uniref:Alpha-mannosidase n=1 Tax=Glossina morsitans morsitans TaxID=37546 RepID=A0A905ATF6_GLOMM
TCPVSKENFINVHVVPHVHTDVGWIDTVSGYYYNSVIEILDTVMQQLLRNRERRFVFAEMVYFFKWFNDLTLERQKIVRELVEEGRLEFVGGAWSVNDEATVHYQSVIDQFTLGLKCISLAFGNCARPTVGWQIDTFGHSRVMAGIFAQMGYDGQFFSRIDFEEKEILLKSRSLELIWQTRDDFDENLEIFSGIFYDNYAKLVSLFALETFDNKFVESITNMSRSYRGTDLLLPLGGDFYTVDYHYLDVMINNINALQRNHSKVNVFYSTPACYLQALHRAQLTWPTKTQDFFPYASKPYSYWTGYFTSRPTFKYFIHLGNHFLQVAKQLAVLSRLHGVPIAMQNLSELKQAMGIMLHHDAVTGTSRQNVANDYIHILASAFSKAEDTAKKALQKLTNLKDGEFVSCLLLNISICDITQSVTEDWLVTVYNALTRVVKHYVRIPVPYGLYRIEDGNGNVLQSQLVPLPRELIDLNELRPNITQYELVFRVEVEKMSHYHVRRYPNRNNFLLVNATITTKRPNIFQTTSRESKILHFESKMRELKSEPEEYIVENSDVEQTFQYYGGKHSGAYIFVMDSTTAENVEVNQVKLNIYEGPLVKEVHQHFNDWISQVIRIYEDVNRVEFEWLLGPIPIADDIGKEVITKFRSGISNGGIFYTDSNGREMIKRTQMGNKKLQTYKEENIPSIYYPVNGRLVLEEEGKGARMAVLNDRAQGGSSTEEGALELMLHRRLLSDDNLGVGEALNEIENGRGLVARGKLYMILNSGYKEPAIEERLTQQEIHLPPWLFFSRPFANISSAVNANFSSLPEGIEVLSLEPFMSYETLLRLEYLVDCLESAPITFDLQPLLVSLKAEEILETTLDGNMLLKDMKRFKFQKGGEPTDKLEYYTTKHKPVEEKLEYKEQSLEITMNPMQIRTFRVKHSN